MEARVKSSLECIRRISGVRVLVVGDVMLDTYLDCRALGVADEAPVPLLEVRSQSSALGGAANVARNLARLGAHTALVGLVGGDSQGEVVGKLLRESGVDGLLLRTQRPTILKTRVLSGDHYYLRLDEEQLSPLTEAEQAALAAHIEAQLSQADLLVVSDYDKGLLSPVHRRKPQNPAGLRCGPEDGQPGHASGAILRLPEPPGGPLPLPAAGLGCRRHGAGNAGRRPRPRHRSAPSRLAGQPGGLGLRLQTRHSRRLGSRLMEAASQSVGS